MKKAITILIAVTILSASVFASSYFILTSPKDKGDFSVGNFSEEIELFGVENDKNYGSITDYKSAAKVGKLVIDEEFGENSAGSAFKWVGCDVRYDKENEMYYIRTYHISPLVLGGAYDVIIKADGTILAVWGEE